MRCIVIDDEPLARKCIENYIHEIPFLEHTGSYINPTEAMAHIKGDGADLLFLDIQMPRMTGIEMLKTVRPMPISIITTAFPEYSIESYELDVLDYLLKPISFDRFVKAVNKAKDYFDLLQRKGERADDDLMFIKCDGQYVKVAFDEIVYIEAMQNYVVIQLEERKLISYLKIRNVMDYLPEDKFIRINKSQIIPVARISVITGNDITLGKYHFKIARPAKEDVLEKILGKRLVKRK